MQLPMLSLMSSHASTAAGFHICSVTLIGDCNYICARLRAGDTNGNGRFAGHVVVYDITTGEAACVVVEAARP